MSHRKLTKEEVTLLFVGSFTDKKPGKGIHIYEFNEETGSATLRFTIDNITNTSFQKFINPFLILHISFNIKIAMKTR